MPGICLKHGGFMSASCPKCKAKPIEVSSPKRVFELPKGPYGPLFLAAVREAAQVLLKNYAASVKDDRMSRIYNEVVDEGKIGELIVIPDDWLSFVTAQLGRAPEENVVYQAVTTYPPMLPGISPLDQIEVMQAVLLDRRCIYVPSEAVQWQTLLHEMLHLSSHKDFYTELAQNDPILGKLNEGVTEYFTRLATPETDRTGCYDAEYGRITVLLTDGVIDKPLLLAAFFQGDKTAIKSLKDASFAKREEKFLNEELGTNLGFGMDLNKEYKRGRKK